ncbi:hypothetical protein FKW77_001105 [Venturia effusa]|uniref:Uncharacterized protein n=1 Tax=Venturia effusa TaxID=50376 RepID=A0A517L4U0_9PEZI|nr:hypothetical protein FKW77_001105 [Venturia effusa]
MVVPTGFTAKSSVRQHHRNMLQFNPALAWSMSRPVSTTYGRLDPGSESHKRWRSKLKSLLTGKSKQKKRMSLEDENKLLSPASSTSSLSSFAIVGIKEAVQRDGPLFARPCVSSWSLRVQINGNALEESSPASLDNRIQREIMKASWKREVWDSWEAEIESRAENSGDYELIRAW